MEDSDTQTNTETAELVLDRTLELVEQAELLSLRWGYVDGSLTLDNADELAQQALHEASDERDPQDIIEELLARKLLVEFSGAEGKHRVRSRFAEGVRLLSRLRQLMPQRSWQSAATLVSDFRVDARPRLVPRRDIRADQALTNLAALLGTPDRRAIAQTLLRAGSNDEVSLAGFQVRAAEAVLRNESGSRGIVISAGTGSGKTLAFYLPALVEIGSWVETNVAWTKAVAVYPRRELLKDQFTQAFRLARRVDDLLRQQGRRPITAGTLFGLTPQRADATSVARVEWQRAGAAFVCPYLLCPICSAEMMWLERDLERGLERLVCRRAPRCPGAATDDQVVLTRSKASSRPPDLLFTTAETLNQRLADSYQRHILGIQRNRGRRVRLALLDEIHTYEGATGAHTALVLRRWRYAVGSPLRIIGLSATLREAPEFFSQLTGLAHRAVTEITPAEHELREISAAYQLILRGDPASQTSLLSTSIQASFLLQRLLDPVGANGSVSHGRAGSRTFVFTDDLDVTNRLFDDLRDAEGYDIFGRHVGDREPLASLRASSLPEGARRDAAGQRWRLSEDIGWPLQRGLRISRTTSQDAGVASASDVVVATSALEVGFNDTTVGAVLQHKSPRQMAAFIQRRGRAGRTTDMRPWMVTVLSDYGRDRLTYQAYERLFDPALDPLRLPIRNQYLLRMQAGFSFADWLAAHHDNDHLRGWWWRAMNGPPITERDRAQQHALSRTLRDLVRCDPVLLEDLEKHLCGSLGLARDDVASLLWEPPRSLLLEFVPTLSRRVHTKWQTAHVPPAPYVQSLDIHAAPPRVHPLPDFLPGNLFSDLSLPEVAVQLPPATVRDEARTEVLPIVTALRQVAPGRVTRRFAFERGGLSHWVPVPLRSGHSQLSVSQFANESEYVGEVPVIEGENLVRVPCYRPWAIAVEKAPPNVGTTSNAVMLWGSELAPITQGLSFPIERAQGWERPIREVEFFLHAFRTPVTTRRFAIGSSAQVRLRRSTTEYRVETRFTQSDHNDALAAVGFEQDVDGIRVAVALPSREEVSSRVASSPELPALRMAYVRDCFLNDTELSSEANWFLRDWLATVYLSALITQAELKRSNLADAAGQLHAGNSSAPFDEVLGSIFQSGTGTAVVQFVDGAPPPAEPEDEFTPGRLHDELRDLLSRPQVRERLHYVVGQLLAPDPLAWSNWLIARTHESLGEALQFACQLVAPQQAALDTLILDLQRLPGRPVSDDGLAEIWITESSPGGVGVVEAIAHAFAADPRVLFKALDAAIAPSDLELTSHGLDRFVELAITDPTVARQVARVRQLSDHVSRSAAQADLFRVLAGRGVGVHHSLSTALNHRLLREGTDTALDQLLLDALEYWRALEKDFAVAIDLRLFSYLASRHKALGPRLRSLIRTATGATASQDQMVGVVASLVWPRSTEARARFFEGYSPFRPRGYSNPALVRDLLLLDGIAGVSVGDPSWQAIAIEMLTARGATRLFAEPGNEEKLKDGLLRMIATPVSIDFLQFFPAVERIVTDGRGLSATVVLRDVA